MSSSMVIKVSLGDDLRRVPVADPGAFGFANLGETFRSMFAEKLPSDFAVQYVDDEGDTIVVSSDAELQEAFRVAFDDKRKSLRFTIIENPISEALAQQVIAEAFESAKVDPEPQPEQPKPEQTSNQAQVLFSTLMGAASNIARATQEATPAVEPPKPAVPENKPKEEERNGFVVHRRIICDGCDACPAKKQAALAAGTIKRNGVILGIRYKSAVTQDFDLCSTCEATGEFEEVHAPFLKINHPSKALAAILAVVDEGDNGSNHPNWRKNGNGAGRCGGRGGPGRCGGGGRRHRWAQQQQQMQHQMQHQMQQHQQQMQQHQQQMQMQQMQHQHQQQAQQVQQPQSQAHAEAQMAEAVQRSLEEHTKAGAGAAAVPPVPPAPPAPPKRLQARFVSDVTVPDGTVLQPGESFAKTWKLRNCGPGAWPESVHFMHVGGDMIHADGGPKVQVPLQQRTIGKGEEMDITVEMKAPMKPGRYVTYWRLVNKATGVRFGHRVWADITVELPPMAAPASQPVVATPVVAAAVPEPAPEAQAEVSSISQEAALAVSAQLQQETQETQGDQSPFVMVEPAPAAEAQGEGAAVAAPAVVEAEAPPAPTPSPPAAEPDAASEPYQVQLQMLADMGFFDRERLIPLLQTNNGDVQRVLEQVL